MIDFSKKIAVKAYETCSREGEIADYLRTEYDREYGPTWNVVVGRHFGTDVSIRLDASDVCNACDSTMERHVFLTVAFVYNRLPMSRRDI